MNKDMVDLWQDLESKTLVLCTCKNIYDNEQDQHCIRQAIWGEFFEKEMQKIKQAEHTQYCERDHIVQELKQQIERLEKINSYQQEQIVYAQNKVREIHSWHDEKKKEFRERIQKLTDLLESEKHNYKLLYEELKRVKQ